MQRKIGTRKIDELGRIILPQEARNSLGSKQKQSLDVYIEIDSILLKPNYDIPTCRLCGETEMDLVEIDHLLICVDCLTKIKEI